MVTSQITLLPCDEQLEDREQPTAQAQWAKKYDAKLDQLQEICDKILARLEVLENSSHPGWTSIKGGNVVSLGEGCWALALTSPLSVGAIFTGSY